jgi:hypothetical protein
MRSNRHVQFLSSLFTALSLALIFIVTSGANVHAQVYGPNAEERKFRLDAHFTSASNDMDSWLEEADRQFSHIFGVMHSPKLIKQFGLNPDYIGGIGAPLLPVEYSDVKGVRQADGSYLVSYRAKGKIILHTAVANELDTKKEIELPLPTDLENFYDKKCTDEHYDSFGDFWYFYDPYRRGCEKFSRPPLADTFTFKLAGGVTRKLDMNLRLDLLRGPNGNGDTFRIDVVHGFESSQTSRSDDGRVNFNDFNTWMGAQGFQLTKVQTHPTRPLNLWTKTLSLPNGKDVNLEVRSFLVETEITARAKSFAVYFKEAVENADVIFYAGHSGLGGNLDIPSLEEKAGGFKFNTGKRQIFFFESCSSYSYYLDSFRAEKTRARIDVVTNGLSSYFDTGHVMINGFMEVLFDETTTDTTWDEVLGKIESGLLGRSYLTNVGGI